MRRTLTSKRMLITGASRGIGKALALEAARRGARLVLAARSADRLQETAREAREIGAEAIAVVADVTNPTDREAMFRTALDQFGGLDILLNNAGVGANGHFVDLTPEILRRIMEVNFFAVAENCRIAIPILANGNQPLIVNLSSMAGRRGVPAWTEYSASKFAVCGFSEALRAELARFDIDLLLVIPGLTTSELGDNLLANKAKIRILHRKGMPTEKLARRVMDGIERNKKELRIERDARLMLLVNWLAPRFVDSRMAKVVRRLYAEEIASRRRDNASPEPRLAPAHPK